MKLITCLKNINDIDKLNFVDEVIIPTKYSIYYDELIEEAEIKQAINKLEAMNVKAIISIDALISEEKLDEVFNFINQYLESRCDFIFSDFAVLSYFRSNNLDLSRLIYSSSTYICNCDDIQYFHDLNIRVFVSNELSLDDLVLNCKYDNVILQAYGYFPIYYSKRNVLSLFKSYAGIDFDVNKEYEIKEELRDEKYIIKEFNDFDTHSVILNAYQICIYKELNDINPNYIYVNTSNIDVLKIYYEGLSNSIFSIDNELALKNIDERIDKSLLYIRPSILNKDEKN